MRIRTATAGRTSSTRPTAEPERISSPKRSFRSWSLRKRFLTLLLLACSVEIGCFVPIYDSSPDDRTRQLIYVSESLRHIPRIWERIWHLDMPDLSTPYRTHGGVI